MAAPHLDNPYGAKGGQGGRTDEGKGKSGKMDKGTGEKGKGNVGFVGQSDSDSDLPKCAHPFCNEPSDPTNFPVGLPWSSGLLKCLPGYCTKHRRESIAEMMASEDMGGEIENEEFAKFENVCKCKDPPPLVCPHKQDDSLTDKSKVCGKPYPKYIYPDDPCVKQELSFFLRMMMVADEMDRWQEEDQKREREEAKKRREEAKKRREKEKKKGDNAKGGKTDGEDKKKKPKSPKDKSAKPADKGKTKPASGGNIEDT